MILFLWSQSQAKLTDSSRNQGLVTPDSRMMVETGGRKDEVIEM